MNFKIKDFIVHKHPLISAGVLVLAFTGLSFGATYENNKQFNQALNRATVIVSVDTPDPDDNNQDATINLHLVKTASSEDEQRLQGYFNNDHDKTVTVPIDYYYDHEDELKNLEVKPTTVQQLTATVKPLSLH